MMTTGKTSLTGFLGATALCLLATTGAAQSTDCAVVDPTLAEGCEPGNAGDAIAIPVGVNTEAPQPAGNGPQGFVISINGNAIAGDTSTAAPIAKAVRRTDVALANADIQVTFDGLGTKPRLDLTTVGPVSSYVAGQSVTLQSSLNYPAFVSRAEMRIIDLGARGGPRTLGVVAVNPNGQAAITVPQGQDIVVVHRVYDSAGRYDETHPLSLMRIDRRGLTDGVEDGNDSTARRRINVSGGAVTVRGADVVAGARVVALGEVVKPDRDGGFIIQRILPAGDYGVDVAVNGTGQKVNLTRDVTVPTSEWFSVGTLDLTYGERIDGQTDERTTYSTGRAAFYVDGKTDGGTRFTASVDTGEGDLDEIFRNLDQRDPRSLLLRVDPGDLYPTYGDDSTIEDRTPTAGKVYLRVENSGNYLQWGNFKSDLGDNGYVRNERALYGLSAGLVSQSQTKSGEPRAQAVVYAAQPDMLAQRDTFLGTGGTVFFLEKQDIAGASETLSIQLRDPDTGRITETRELVAGRDYDINYIQGIVTLTRALSASSQDGLFQGGATGTSDVVLVAQYEYRPQAGDLDGYAYGARGEAWLTDTVRVGVSGMLDETGATDHQAIGADILYKVSEDTFVRLEYAQSKGTGFDSTYSADAGLIVDDIAASGTSGEAIKIEGRSSLVDLGLGMNGAIGAYFERRTEGFSTLDVQTTAATGDEEFWGAFIDTDINDRTTFGLAVDSYETAQGARDLTVTAQVDYALSRDLTLALGLEHLDKISATETGTRTDLAARLTYDLSDTTNVYVFGQSTISADGLDENNRYGVGGAYDFGNGWIVSAEVSDGTTGEGGKVTGNYTDDAGNTRYLGYELTPDRDFGGIVLVGRDQGRFVAGGSQVVNDDLTVYGENSYDLFGRHKSLTSAYGLTYQANTALNLTASFEMGQVNDGDQYDFDRKAVTLGAIYEDEKLRASGRVEYRIEDGIAAGQPVTADTLLINTNAQYKFDDVQRLVFSAELARTETEQNALLDGNYADVVLGYAYRPIEDNRLNVLARYRYLHDLYGLREADQTDGPRQRSHVMSVDASYDLDRNWTLGGKIGYRSTQSAADSASDFVSNDAWLAIANARYHLVHDWDALIEVRNLSLTSAGTNETSALGAVYKHLGNNVKLGVGYNFGSFSDDLTDLTQNDKGAFINLVAKF